ncbi:unnamed protein product (macronuclear) [Paramecium tetraurelia]|uniref:Uncharacterized protein n=1 Tax=Paramecium tetraurelia TaxID=5888 RepID=A0CDH2_PARTE|nr:uncharacterized protein GSPATT00007050001 [Paramecium tetraurelia]CAK68839.1 unnamed protein product [Paramecium tetraurelia]|eukprot:XP_001436236.1 hypothetical protein (macronuclear) [Paramecium tetraurelia strain d4-2]
MIENRLIFYDELKEPDHPLSEKPISELNLPEIILLTENISCYGKFFSVVFQRKLLAGIVDKVKQRRFGQKGTIQRLCCCSQYIRLKLLERIAERHEVGLIENGVKLRYATSGEFLQIF